MGGACCSKHQPSVGPRSPSPRKSVTFDGKSRDGSLASVSVPDASPDLHGKVSLSNHRSSDSPSSEPPRCISPVKFAARVSMPRAFVVDAGSRHTEVFAYDQGPDGMPVILHSAKLRRDDQSLMTLGDTINDGSDETFELFFKLLSDTLAAFDSNGGPEPAIFIGATGGVRKIRDSDAGARKVDQFARFCRCEHPNVTFRVVEGLDEVRWEWTAAKALFHAAFEDAGHEGGVQLLAGGGSSVQVGIRGMSTAEGGVSPVSMPLSVGEVQDAFKADAAAAAGEWPSLERSRQSLERVVDASWPHLRAHAPIRGGVLAMSGFADIAQLGFSERWISVEELKPLVDKTLDELLKQEGAGWDKAVEKWGKHRFWAEFPERLWSIGAAGLLRLSVLLTRPGLFRPSARLYFADTPPPPPEGTAPRPKLTWPLGKYLSDVQLCEAREQVLAAGSSLLAARTRVAELTPPGNPTSRTGYLRSLRDCVGPPPDDCMEKWREEWVKLRTEEYLRSDDPADKDKGTEEYVRENKDLDSVLTKFARGIKESVDSGMDPKHAMIYYALQSVRGSLAAAMREGRRDYVCSTYALSEALSSEYDLQKKLALPPSLYKNLEGKFGLASDDSQWSSIRTPDEAGFRGLVSEAMVMVRPAPHPRAAEHLRAARISALSIPHLRQTTASTALARRASWSLTTGA